MATDRPDSEPLQPGNGLHGSLVKFEETSAAQELSRQADADILLELQLTGFDPDSDEWRTFARTLAEYGYAVFTAWGVTGLLRTKAAQFANGQGVRGLAKLPEYLSLGLDDDDAHALAAELLPVAIEKFRTDSLMDRTRTWRADGGASLKTFFIGRCLMELPDVYQAWNRQDRHRVGDGYLDARPVHVDDDLVDEAPILELLDGDEVALAMFKLKAQGYSYEEIADMMETTVSAVRSRIHRARGVARSSQRHR